MDIKISVILPVYNVAAYIGDCIQSLRTQTLDGLEFIFVDDCSTDGTMRAVEAFAAEDSRVRIIRFRENQGPGAARNAGIEAAKGRYLSFVDPDDWIAPDFYARLYAKAESSQCDIIKGRTIGLSGSNGVKDPWWENMNRRMREKLSRNVPLFCAGCYDHFSALYSAALFSNGSVRYGLARKSEDLTFLLKASFHTDSIAFEDGAVYYYRISREMSATQVFSAKRIGYEMESLAEKIDFLLGKEWNDYSYQYIARRTQVIVDNYCAFACLSMAPKSADEAFAQEILPIIRRVPEYEKLSAFSKELYALLKHGFPIPARCKDTERFHFDRIVRWTDFLISTPSEREQCTGVFITAILQTAVDRANGQRRNLRNKAFYTMLRKQLNRLDRGYRSVVISYIPFAFVRFAFQAMADRFAAMYGGRKQRNGRG